MDILTGGRSEVLESLQADPEVKEALERSVQQKKNFPQCLQGI